MAEPLQPLSLGQLLDRTVRFYGRNAGLFIGIAIPSVLMALAAQVAPMLITVPPLLRPAPGMPLAFHPAAAWYLLGYVVILVVVAAYVSGATTWAVSHLELGETVSIRRCYGEIRGHAGSVVLTSLLAMLCAFGPVAAALLLAVVSPPGSLLLGTFASLLLFAGVIALVWIAMRLVVAIPAVVLERQGAVAAIRRSAALTKGSLGRVFLLLLAAMCAFFAVTMTLGIAGGIGLVVAHSLRVYEFSQLLAGAISGVLLTPLMSILFALLYFDLKVRKEGFDLEVLLRQRPAAADADA